MSPAALPPLLLPWLFPSAPFVAEELPLNEAVKRGLISVTARSTGGFGSACVHLELVNHADRPIRTVVPPGWFLQNSDPEAQDLMIVDRRPVEVPPQASYGVACKAYCMESSDRSPAAGTMLHSMGFANAMNVRLAEYMVSQNVDDANVQAAVWAVANGHDIAAIGADDVRRSADLRRFVAELTGRPLPWYAKNYAAPTDDGRVFSDQATTIHGSLDFAITSNGVVTVLVHNARGTLLRTIGKDRHLGPGNYTMDVDLTVQGWPQGDYTISFYLDGSRLLKRLPFIV